MFITLGEVAKILGGTLENGKADDKIHHIAPINEAQKGSIAFLRDKAWKHFVYSSEAAILVNQDWEFKEAPLRAKLIRVKDVLMGISILLGRRREDLHPEKLGVEEPSFIGEDVKLGTEIYRGAFSYIGDRTQIGSHAKIFPHTYIGHDCKIGDHTVVGPGTKIHPYTEIGEHVVISSNCCLGEDFGFFKGVDEDFYRSLPHIGKVVIGDWVYIGVGCVIDRALLSSTQIEDRVKIGHGCGIGHGSHIKENAVLAGGSALAGSTQIGKNCRIGIRANFSEQVRIADFTSIGIGTNVTRSLNEEGEAWTGLSPVMKCTSHARSVVNFSKLPELIKRLDKIENQLSKERGSNK
ncbi:MAG: UDP-3-O-(3-hydroxymyristoyl)glucosamine N-acyltransferase [Cytophagales bacterium]|nr:UDP-3-O-(3-hydroxymyristoyl)glucosamine N-acyltransferase [Cytophagales bacterium]